MAEPAKESPKKKAGARGPRKKGLQLKKHIIEAFRDNKSRKGTSVVCVKKALKSQGVDMVKCNSRINRTIKKLEDKGVLVRCTGIGASGSFRLAKTKEPAAKPRVSKVRKPSVKRPAGKKPASKKQGIKKKQVSKKQGKTPTSAKRRKPTGGKPVKRVGAKAKVKKQDNKKKVNTPRKRAKGTPVKRPSTKKPTPKKTSPKKSKK